MRSTSQMRSVSWTDFVTRVAATLKQALGVAVNVKLVEPKTIQRSEGKAKRVIDNRDM